MRIEMKLLKKPKDLSSCFDIRNKVFVDEQKFDASIEIDEIDDIAYHVILTLDNCDVATARFFKVDDYYKIGRFCVLKEYRKNNLGSVLMAFIEEEVVKLGGSKLVLSSQLQAKKFYEVNGFIQKDEVYLEEGVEHIKMFKKIGV